MSDDIVARLREEGFVTHIAQLPRESKLLHEAADEIERLRLESAIPRDEYAMAWKALLDRIDGLDIVLWLRAYATSHNPSDYVSPIAREVIVRSDRRWIEAADQIERLRAEVERLRRRVERLLRGQTTTQFFAEAERLRDELAARCGDARPGAHTAGPSETFIPEAL